VLPLCCANDITRLMRSEIWSHVPNSAMDRKSLIMPNGEVLFRLQFQMRVCLRAEAKKANRATAIPSFRAR
jgi:hypothetical protein